MRPVRLSSQRRPYRHFEGEDLLLMCIIGSANLRIGIEHELDLRTARRLAGRLPADFFADDLPTGGRFSRRENRGSADNE